MNRLALVPVAALSLALSTAAFAKPPPTAHKFTYKVMKGDTLECLDQKFHIQPMELAHLNGGGSHATTFKLVAGKTINTPVKVPANACAGSTAGGHGATPSLHDQACQVIDRTKHYTNQQALALLHTLSQNQTCLKAANILSQPTAEKLCEAVGTLLHAHHATHSMAESIEVLCQSAHLVAHAVHQAGGSHDTHGGHDTNGGHEAPANQHPAGH